jgi:hypothetical protein
MVKPAWALAAIAAIACAAPLYARDIHVDIANPAAADNNPGSVEKPLKSIAKAATLAGPGDTVLIHPGIYRESITLKTSGAPGKPITFKAATPMSEKRTLVTGADLLQGWKKADKKDLANNPNAGKIMVLDLPELPPRLYENGHRLTIARTPKAGWWHITAGLDPKDKAALTTFSDKDHLTQSDPHAWDNWDACVLDEAGGGFKPIPVASFDPASHTITLSAPYSADRDKIDPKRDRYFFQNSLAALDGPGQYAYRKSANGYRLFLWPTALDNKGQPNIEAPSRRFQFDYTDASNITIDGLECGYCTETSILSLPADENTRTSPANSNVTVQDCYLHDNGRYGIVAGFPQNFLARHNIIRDVSNGIVVYTCADSTIEENDIGPCTADGIDGADKIRGLKILRNYVHDCYFLSHPDNLQFWADCKDVVIDGNLCLNGGSGIQSSGLASCRVVNNTFMGSNAPLITMAASGPCELRHNTFVGSTLSPMALSGPAFALEANIIAPLRDYPCYGIEGDFKADYNLLWNGAPHKLPVVIKGAWKDSASAIEDIRSKFNLEQHGVVADPKFIGAPRFFAFTDYSRVADCTTSTMLMHDPIGDNILVGDFVELAFDGVPRKVTATTADSFTFEPPLPATPEVNLAVLNWGKPATSGGEKHFKLDLRLADDSPGKKAGPNGSDIGSGINIDAYKNGDFNNDGKRDLPTLPKE